VIFKVGLGVTEDIVGQSYIICLFFVIILALLRNFVRQMELQDEHIIPNVIGHYNLDEEQEKKEIVRKYRALLRALRPKIKKGDKELLRTAFEMAANAHKTMRRKSGEPYIFHPIAVAMICVDEIGLVFWNTIAFLLLLVVLGKFAWKPIIKAINERESSIEEALLKADKMKAEITAMQNENEALLAKAREERATLIKEAKEASEKMVADAKDKAKAEYDKILADAQLAITQQKNAALTDVKNQVGSLIVEVAEKVLRKELSNKADQESYIKQLADGVKLN